jgi:hypothetical protein
LQKEWIGTSPRPTSCALASSRACRRRRWPTGRACTATRSPAGSREARREALHGREVCQGARHGRERLDQGRVSYFFGFSGGGPPLAPNFGVRSVVRLG